jgi:hypothetical protein
MFDPEKVARYDGIDVDGVNGSEGWGLGLRCEGDREITMVLASDYDQLLELYRKEKKFAHDGCDPDIDIGSLPTVEQVRGLLDKSRDPKTP